MTDAADQGAAAALDTRQPAAEDILKLAGAQGWDFFEGAGPKVDQLRAQADPKQQRLALVAMVLWQIPEFRELIEHLLDVTVRRDAFHPSFGLPMDQAYGYGMFRSGQNSVVHLVMKMIAEGRQQAAPAPRDIAQ